MVDSPRFQFGLGRLLVATTLIAASAGVARLALWKGLIDLIATFSEPARSGAMFLLLLATLTTLGAGIGALFGRTGTGAFYGAAVPVAILVLLLAAG